jgi:hypothetical protein
LAAKAARSLTVGVQRPDGRSRRLSPRPVMAYPETEVARCSRSGNA